MGNIEPWSTPEDRFGRNVRRHREAAGLSQKELAGKLQEFGLTLHASAIAKIEARDTNSPRSIRLDEAEAIARALGASLSDLLSGPEAEAVFNRAADLLDQAVAIAEHSVTLVMHALETLKDGLEPSQIDQYWTADSPEPSRHRDRIISAFAQLNQIHQRADLSHLPVPFGSGGDDGEHQ